MGLAERRVIHEFQTKELSVLEGQVEEAAGFKVPVEVNWDALTPEGESRLYAESWRKVYFEPLIAALKAIGGDEMGREALKKGLHPRVELADIKQATPYLEMGVKHFCIGWDVRILHDWWRANGEGMRALLANATSAETKAVVPAALQTKQSVAAY